MRWRSGPVSGDPLRTATALHAPLPPPLYAPSTSRPSLSRAYKLLLVLKPSRTSNKDYLINFVSYVRSKIISSGELTDRGCMAFYSLFTVEFHIYANSCHILTNACSSQLYPGQRWLLPRVLRHYYIYGSCTGRGSKLAATGGSLGALGRFRRHCAVAVPVTSCSRGLVLRLPITLGSKKKGNLLQPLRSWISLSLVAPPCPRVYSTRPDACFNSGGWPMQLPKHSPRLTVRAVCLRWGSPRTVVVVVVLLLPPRAPSLSRRRVRA